MEILMTKTQEEWLEVRANRFTASVIHKLMGNPRNGGLLSKTAETFVYEKAAEILTGHSKPIFGEALDWGIENESLAFDAFQKEFFAPYTYYGGETYVFIPYGKYSGYSPDGLSEDSILEIKCPFNSGIHLKNFMIEDAETLKAIHPEYYWQMQLGMISTNTNEGYFASFDPRMPNKKRLHVARIERQDVQDKIDTKLQVASVLLNQIIK